MRREGVFSSVITLEKSKNQKTKKQGSTLKKSQGKEKCSFVRTLGFCGKHHRPAHFLEEKKSESHPSFFISKKKKILKMKKVERKN